MITISESTSFDKFACSTSVNSLVDGLFSAHKNYVGNLYFAMLFCSCMAVDGRAAFERNSFDIYNYFVMLFCTCTAVDGLAAFGEEQL